MPARMNLGQCHFCDNPAVRLMAEGTLTREEDELGLVEYRAICSSCFDRFGAQHLGGAR